MCGGSLSKKHQTYLIYQNGAGKETEVGNSFGCLFRQLFNRIVTFAMNSLSVGASQRKVVVEGTVIARKLHVICAARHFVFARGAAETLLITLFMRKFHN